MKQPSTMTCREMLNGEKGERGGPTKSFVIEEVAPDIFRVTSSKLIGKRRPKEQVEIYLVDLRNPSCTCMWWTLKGMKEKKCKHIRLCEYYKRKSTSTS